MCASLWALIPNGLCYPQAALFPALTSRYFSIFTLKKLLLAAFPAAEQF